MTDRPHPPTLSCAPPTNFLFPLMPPLTVKEVTKTVKINFSIIQLKLLGRAFLEKFIKMDR